MEGERWSTGEDQLANTGLENCDLLSKAVEKGGSLEKGRRKKNLGLDFMLRKIENDEKGSLVLTAEAEKAMVQGETSEMEAKALKAVSGGVEEVDRLERIECRVGEEMMKEDGNDMLADVVASAVHSGLSADKKVEGMKRNLSLGFMLGKPSKGVDGVEAVNEPDLEKSKPDLEKSKPDLEKSKPDVRETAVTRDVLDERVSNSSLKLSATDRKVQGVKRNLGLGFMLKKPSKGEPEIVANAEKASDGSIPNQIPASQTAE